MNQVNEESVVEKTQKLISESARSEFCLVRTVDLRDILRKARERDHFYNFIVQLRDGIPRYFKEFFEDYPDPYDKR